jgi:hypothetical protein
MHRSVKDAQKRDADGALRQKQHKGGQAADTEDGEDGAPGTAAEDGDDDMEGLAAYERGPRRVGKVCHKASMLIMSRPALMYT